VMVMMDNSNILLLHIFCVFSSLFVKEIISLLLPHKVFIVR
jgi:hypothetical protein